MQFSWYMGKSCTFSKHVKGSREKLQDVYESVHPNTIMKVTNKMQLYRLTF